MCLETKKRLNEMKRLETSHFNGSQKMLLEQEYMKLSFKYNYYRKQYIYYYNRNVESEMPDWCKKI